MPHCKIHNVRFYEPEPQAIRCMSLQSTSKKLAVARSDSTIEIWNLNNVWYIERTIHPTVENFSIEGLACRLAVTGESAFCLDINKNKIAIGTEKGYLNIFRIAEDEINFDKFLDKQEGRIICLKFEPSGEFIVSGSIDAIRVWNVGTGHAIHKMTTGRSDANKPTIVWCLEVTNDFTIISGDSRGKLTFWDSKVGSQIESYQSHKADILTLCLSDDQKSLYCAGRALDKWVKSIQRKIHEHDVNSLVFCENKLYSGGADGYLACSYYPPKTLLKLPPVLQGPCVHVAADARYILLRYAKHIEIWTLGKAGDVETDRRGMLHLENEPKKLLVLNRLSKDYNGEEEKEGINCSCMSNDGKWIFFSTCKGVRLFQFVYVNEKPNLLKVDELEHKYIPSVQAVFSPNSSQLIVAPNTGGLIVYDLKDGRSSVNTVLDNKGLEDTITFLTTSSCGKYLIAGDAKSNIVIWISKKAEWCKYCKLPKYQHPPTALGVHPNTSYLIVAYSDSKVVEYDIKKRHFTDFSNNLGTIANKQWKSRSNPIRNITFDPRVNNIIVLHDDSNIIIIDKK
ncbi:hypothetical protein NQ317_013159 [Molorchus minor]|uniref:Anaphase-promoting complex subunit 4-like WD40 domain-containing protein n=1 Tax=Molorchus minor TaxID=1323400 RepID=A0ABQ9JZC4_9CUCU|nr:hypothetical protein NQ317_013159 [Molorchus minor]